MANRGGFSWKRALGVTRAKQSVSRKTGIPMTRSGRQRKFGKAMGCGCMLPVLSALLIVVTIGLIIAFAG